MLKAGKGLRYNAINKLYGAVLVIGPNMRETAVV